MTTVTHNTTAAAVSAEEIIDLAFIPAVSRVSSEWQRQRLILFASAGSAKSTLRRRRAASITFLRAPKPADAVADLTFGAPAWRRLAQ
jgi:hypothetical protein